MIRTILYIFSIYFLYKFIFEFLVPVFRTTSKIQRDMRSMHQRMEEQMNAQRGQGAAAPKATAQEDSTAPPHEYIEFEEVKK